MTQIARHLPYVLALLAGAVSLPCAQADVYTWVDASGRMNVSNLTPPEGARITSVIPTVPKTAAQEEADREAARRAEILALNDRVSRLQEELEMSRRPPPPPPMSYGYPTPPPAPQYSYWAPPEAPYAMDASTQWSMTCDWPSACAGLWNGWGYPPGIVVLGGSDFRRGNPHRGDRPIGPRPPGRPRPMMVSHRS